MWLQGRMVDFWDVRIFRRCGHFGHWVEGGLHIEQIGHTDGMLLGSFVWIVKAFYLTCLSMPAVKSYSSG
jgi:hypothetical protein